MANPRREEPFRPQGYWQTEPGWPRPVDPWLLWLAMLVPSGITLFYFVLLHGHETRWQQLAFLAGKSAQFGLPILLCGIPEGRAGGRSSSGAAEVGKIASWYGVGVASGVVMAAVVLGGYFFILRQSDDLLGLSNRLGSKLSGLGMASPWRYLGMSVFYCLIHSLMEEYYWRWFLFRQWTHHVSVAVAILLSSLAFAAHHVILLGVLIGWTSWITYVASVGVAIGGAFWAWLYWRSGRLPPGWLSHLLVDAALMGIGFAAASSLWAQQAG